MSFNDCSFCDKPVWHIIFDNFLSKDVSDGDVDSVCKSSHFSLLNNSIGIPYSSKNKLLSKASTLFWKEKIYSEVKDFPNLDNCEFKKMLLLFWKDYVITDE